MNELPEKKDGAGDRLGPFTLSGAVEKPDPIHVPLRGDLAHVALAGQFFVPHYVVPMQRMIGDGGSSLRASPGDDGEILYDLPPGSRFDLLDIQGEWAWGCLEKQGLVGYVEASDLLDPFS